MLEVLFPLFREDDPQRTMLKIRTGGLGIFVMAETEEVVVIRLNASLEVFQRLLQLSKDLRLPSAYYTLMKSY